MNRNRLWILFLAISLTIMGLLGGCVTAKQKLIDSGIKPLNNEELQVFFSKTVTGRYQLTQKNITQDITYSQDQTVKYIKSNGTILNGTYRLKNDQFCSAFPRGKRCYALFEVADKKYDFFLENGVKHGTLTVQ